MRVGAIDIGSNSIRLLVGDIAGTSPNGGNVKAVARASDTCRLGRGLGRSGLIDWGTAGRAADLAAEFARRARALGAVHTLIGATAALRSASNGAEVAGLIAERAGLPVRILTGDEEARLVYRAVVTGLGPPALRSSCVVFDLGGGSTEVVSGMGAEAGRWVSLPIGAVSLTERYLTTNPPSGHERSVLEKAVRDEIMHGCAYLPERSPVLAGVGGTVTVLALLDRGLSTYEPSLIEGWVIAHHRLEGLVERLAASSQEDRRNWPAMGEGCADIVVAGAVAVGLLAERFPSAGLVCSTQGLRFALARLPAEEAGLGGDGR